jgi:protein-S-isoprenylcysteine O-methyltransferase Ste14
MNRAHLSLLATLAAVLALAGLYYRQELWGTEPISIAVQVAAALFMIWARITFGMRSFHAAATTTEGGLVTSGPYGLVRNPIYAAVILFTWAGVTVHFEIVSAGLAVVITGAMLLRIFIEENELRASYPEYAEYARRVKRLLPWIF